MQPMQAGGHSAAHARAGYSPASAGVLVVIASTACTVSCSSSQMACGEGEAEGRQRPPTLRTPCRLQPGPKHAAWP